MEHQQHRHHHHHYYQHHYYHYQWGPEPTPGRTDGQNINLDVKHFVFGPDAGCRPKTKPKKKDDDDEEEEEKGTEK